MVINKDKKKNHRKKNESKTISFAWRPFDPGDELSNSTRFQRRYVAPLKYVKLFYWYSLGQVWLGCKSSQIKSLQQKVQQTKKYHWENKQIRPCHIRRIYTIKYIIPFYDYCYLWNYFGHKVIDCKIYANKSKTIVYAKENSFVDNGIRRYKLISPFFGHTRCYVCENLGHMDKYWNISCTLKNLYRRRT